MMLWGTIGRNPLEIRNDFGQRLQTLGHGDEPKYKKPDFAVGVEICSTESVIAVLLLEHPPDRAHWCGVTLS
jgi:hypothetical protein